MAMKKFCDCCGNEMPMDEKRPATWMKIRGRREEVMLGLQIDLLDGSPSHRIKSSAENAADICLNCRIDVFNQVDNRPKEMPKVEVPRDSIILKKADVLRVFEHVADLSQHEGAEGFSLSTRQEGTWVDGLYEKLKEGLQ